MVILLRLFLIFRKRGKGSVVILLKKFSDNTRVRHTKMLKLISKHEKMIYEILIILSKCLFSNFG